MKKNLEVLAWGIAIKKIKGCIVPMEMPSETIINGNYKLVDDGFGGVKIVKIGGTLK